MEPGPGRELKAGAGIPAVPGHDVFRATRTFSSLDGLRCLAIVAVVFHHAGEESVPWLILKRGFLGVDLFFVISGFLIVTLLLRERDRRGRISLRDFYARRALRIMPLYYGVLGFTTLLFGFVLTHGNMAGPVRRDLPFCFTYTSNWVTMTSFLGITWSLSAEEQFYLVWPPLEKWAARPARVLGILAVLVVLGEMAALGLFDPALTRVFGAPPMMLREVTFTPILLGVLLAHVLHSPRGYALVARSLGARSAPLVVLAAILLSLAFLPEDLRGWPRLVLHALFLFFVASAVVREDHVLARPLKQLPVRRIGAVSYGMYLIHMFVLPAGNALEHRGMPGALLFPFVLLVTWGLAEASYRLYETRFLALRRRFRG